MNTTNREFSGEGFDTFILHGDISADGEKLFLERVARAEAASLLDVQQLRLKQTQGPAAVEIMCRSELLWELAGFGITPDAPQGHHNLDSWAGCAEAVRKLRAV